MVDETDFCQIALTLPESHWDETAFAVQGKSFAWVYQEKVAGQRGRTEHRDVLAVRVASLDEKKALLAADPKKFFSDAHYAGYPAILVRLTRIEIEELTELLHDAWCLRAPRRMVKEWEAQRHLSASSRPQDASPRE